MELKPEQGKGLMTEVAGNTRQVGGGAGMHRPGVYRHKESGEEAILTVDPLLGDAMVRAFERAGFEYLREVQPGEVVYAVPSHSGPSEGANATLGDVKGLQARLDAIEAENKRLREALEAAPAAPTTTEEAPKVEETTEADASDNKKNNGGNK